MLLINNSGTLQHQFLNLKIIQNGIESVFKFNENFCFLNFIFILFLIYYQIYQTNLIFISL